MNYLVYYGVDFDYIDVTQIVIDNCINNGIAYIPKGEDRRIELFSNHLPGVLKNVFIKNTFTNEITAYNYITHIYIHTINNVIYTNEIPSEVVNTYNGIPSEVVNTNNE
jgi:hypothetical protein